MIVYAWTGMTGNMRTGSSITACFTFCGTSGVSVVEGSCGLNTMFLARQNRSLATTDAMRRLMAYPQEGGQGRSRTSDSSRIPSSGNWGRCRSGPLLLRSSIWRIRRGTSSPSHFLWLDPVVLEDEIAPEGLQVNVHLKHEQWRQSTSHQSVSVVVRRLHIQQADADHWRSAEKRFERGPSS